MKKFFGWFFIVAGVGNIITSFAMMAHGVVGSGSQNLGSKLILWNRVYWTWSMDDK